MIRGRPAPANQPASPRAAETPRGFGGFGVGLSAAAAAAGERKAVGGSPRGPLPRPRPRPETVPRRGLARQGAAPAPPGSPRRGGTFPTGSDPGPSRGTGAPQPVCQGNPSGPDDARGSRGPETRPGGSDWSRAHRPGPARRREQEAGSLGPFVCAGRGRGAGPPLAAGGSRFAAPTASLGGAARLPTPPLRACPPPHAPCLGFGSYRKGIATSSPPTRHLAHSPPPPLTSSSSPVGPSASPHSPPQFADFRPPSASPSRRG
ncbi:ras-related protein Rap-2c isoform X1 [Mustela erminea]|uniref:ras-related protein Rap-2c isoform X1 n=1 Tax=Mustela erminea TaxID=36723 RepID=UPI001386B1C5|nr:ras-related protein Rap-2c isoform X1 [Mustela erminea]